MLSLARAHSAENWPDEAMEVANTAISVFVELGDKLSHARALQLFAELHLLASEFDGALQAAEKSASFFKEMGDADGEASAQRLVTSIKVSLDVNPALEKEMAKKKEVQREIDLLLLNEVASALSQRNEVDFKEKYEKLDRCQNLTADDMTSALAPALQVDYDETQEWISSALHGTPQQHIYTERTTCYMMSRHGGMHYGPNLRLCRIFGHTMPMIESKSCYAVIQMHAEQRDSDWEGISMYHPPMYDCGLQAQMANGITMQHLNWQAENGLLDGPVGLHGW